MSYKVIAKIVYPLEALLALSANRVNGAALIIQILSTWIAFPSRGIPRTSIRYLTL